MLEDLGRLEAFFGQLRPVIGQPLAEEEAEGLRRSMLEHLPQRPLRLGEVRLRLDRAWRSGALPPGAKRRPSLPVARRFFPESPNRTWVRARRALKQRCRVPRFAGSRAAPFG